MKYFNQTHDAGICYINFLKDSEYYFITGSYDQNLRIFDIRNLKTEVSQKTFEGGVWRSI